MCLTSSTGMEKSEREAAEGNGDASASGDEDELSPEEALQQAIQVGLIQRLECRSALYVAESPIQGKGVFARELIKKGAYVCDYYGLIVDRREVAEASQYAQQQHNTTTPTTIHTMSAETIPFSNSTSTTPITTLVMGEQAPIEWKRKRRPTKSPPQSTGTGIDTSPVTEDDTNNTVDRKRDDKKRRRSTKQQKLTKSLPEEDEAEDLTSSSPSPSSLSATAVAKIPITMGEVSGVDTDLLLPEQREQFIRSAVHRSGYLFGLNEWFQIDPTSVPDSTLTIPMYINHSCDPNILAMKTNLVTNLHFSVPEATYLRYPLSPYVKRLLRHYRDQSEQPATTSPPSATITTTTAPTTVTTPTTTTDSAPMSEAATTDYYHQHQHHQHQHYLPDLLPQQREGFTSEQMIRGLFDIVFFVALRDIEPGQELSFHYNRACPSIECCCGKPACTGVM
eukprot:TRINITY_DN9696_c1_g3_i3.p1 TRINITY_DN9696_c1_g3~~TRINITY_DN9696_c1_g3_i3.p1  ORF type:complete len:450 (+),score=106.49 TRINITY_DN9696_c1_g3_i3:315-1664(+)